MSSKKSTRSTGHFIAIAAHGFRWRAKQGTRVAEIKEGQIWQNKENSRRVVEVMEYSGEADLEVWVKLKEATAGQEPFLIPKRALRHDYFLVDGDDEELDNSDGFGDTSSKAGTTNVMKPLTPTKEQVEACDRMLAWLRKGEESK